MHKITLFRALRTRRALSLPQCTTLDITMVSWHYPGAPAVRSISQTPSANRYSRSTIFLYGVSRNFAGSS